MKRLKDQTGTLFVTATLGGLAAIVIAGSIAFILSMASSKIVETPNIEQDYKARGSGREEEKIMILSDKEEEEEQEEDEASPKKKRQKTEVATMED